MYRYTNPFEAKRARNILGIEPMGQTSPMPTNRLSGIYDQPDEPQDEGSRYYDEMTRLQDTMGPGLKAYKEYLTQLPQREDYKPSVWTRVAAGLSGMSAGFRNPAEGIKTAQDLNMSNYRNAMIDYANKGKGLAEQANMEQDELDSKIKALQNARAMGLKYDEFKLKQLEAERKNQVDRMNAGANVRRADAAWATANKKDYIGTPQQDGSTLYTNKSDPNDKVLVGGKSVAAGQLGVARGNLANSVRRTDIFDRSERDANNRGWTSLSIQNERAKNGLNSHIPTPNEQQDATDNALREMSKDPDFSDFITTDAQGYPDYVADDGTEEYKIFLDALKAKTDEIIAGGRRRSRLGGR